MTYILNYTCFNWSVDQFVHLDEKQDLVLKSEVDFILPQLQHGRREFEVEHSQRDAMFHVLRGEKVQVRE